MKPAKLAIVNYLLPNFCKDKCIFTSLFNKYSISVPSHAILFRICYTSQKTSKLKKLGNRNTLGNVRMDVKNLVLSKFVENFSYRSVKIIEYSLHFRAHLLFQTFILR